MLAAEQLGVRICLFEDTAAELDDPSRSIERSKEIEGAVEDRGCDFVKRDLIDLPGGTLVSKSLLFRMDAFDQMSTLEC